MFKDLVGYAGEEDLLVDIGGDMCKSNESPCLFISHAHYSKEVYMQKYSLVSMDCLSICSCWF